MDYEKLGLKCGLEIHQQLDTGKLFCRCKSKLREDKPDFTVKRRIHAIGSELGEYDKAAVETYSRGYYYIYEAYRDNCCLVELDEEPPHKVNENALETVLKIALMVDANILDTLFVMRKAVVDGSNTSGFQRTALVSLGGTLKVDNKDIGVLSIALEEDSARTISTNDEKKEITYRLDRLGIPLIELATAPDMKTPEEAKKVALKIGELLRRTCKAKRGLGTIRQDLNVSIAEGARIEVKGVQELDLIDQYVRREVQRQNALIEIKKELLEKGVTEKSFSGRVFDLTDIFKSSSAKMISKAAAKGMKVKGIKLPHFAGIIGREVQPGRRLGTEFASYVKARAGLRGIFHSDEDLTKHGISEKEIEAVKKTVSCSEKDAFVFVFGTEEQCRNSLKVVNGRAYCCTLCVPEETRNALGDGNTEYSRPLPGAARMYPETDLEVREIKVNYLKDLKNKLPPTVAEREKNYRKFGLSTNLIEGMKLDNHACFFERMVKKGYSATRVAILLLETFTKLKREGISVDEFSEEMIEEFLGAEKKGKFTKEVSVDVLKAWSSSPEKTLDEVIASLEIQVAGKGELEEVIEKIVEENILVVKEKKEHAIGALMGDAMKELRGKASGKEISEMLRKKISEKVK